VPASRSAIGGIFTLVTITLAPRAAVPHRSTLLDWLEVVLGDVAANRSPSARPFLAGVVEMEPDENAGLANVADYVAKILVGVRG